MRIFGMDLARWALVAVLVAAVGLPGCATSKTAEYVDPKTGQSYVCYRQLAFGVIPSVVAGNSFADCKNEFEGRGFVRRDRP
jgi:hypothetical protein